MGKYSKIIAKGTTIHIYEFDPKLERLAYEKGVDMKLETLDKLPRPKDDEITECVVNWNFFDWQKSFNGYGEIEQDGVQTQAPSAGFPSMSFKDNKLVFGDLPKAQVGAGIGYSIIIDGKKNVQNWAKLPMNVKDARTLCGQKKNGLVSLIAVRGDDTKKQGMTPYELADYFYNLGYFNLFCGDGGGSTSMYLGDKGWAYNQGRAVACGLAVYSKNYPTIYQGKKGEAVKVLQRKLIKLGYNLGKWGVDGSFGQATYLAVRQFQKDHNLIVDGICGKNTWAKLKALT